MLKSEFQFDLPESLIAQYPTSERTASRLLYLNRKTNTRQDHGFSSVIDFLNDGDLIIMNNTRVIPARLYGKKQTGGAVEVLIERLLGSNRAYAFVRASKSPALQSVIYFGQDISAKIIGRNEDLFELEFSGAENLLTILNKFGEVPLPPYMNRKVQASDNERYQTVFAEHNGAVAAPTAGLHFDDGLLRKIKQKGVQQAYITLHVGAGTFKPMRVDNILAHKMHAERVDVPESVCEKILATKKQGGKIIAVGTTVVRSLESAALGDQLKALNGETNIFIYPGFKFKVVDMLLTNFHLSESTLLMLVAAFAGREQILNAYKHAVNEKYRFFSYGDAMLID